MTKCTLCHLTVAPYDPERRQVGLDVYHGSCLKEVRRREEETHTRVGRQFALDFTIPAMLQ